MDKCHGCHLQLQTKLDRIRLDQFLKDFDQLAESHKQEQEAALKAEARVKELEALLGAKK
jgi:hypothetical protein